MLVTNPIDKANCTVYITDDSESRVVWSVNRWNAGLTMVAAQEVVHHAADTRVDDYVVDADETHYIVDRVPDIHLDEMRDQMRQRVADKNIEQTVKFRGFDISDEHAPSA